MSKLSTIIIFRSTTWVSLLSTNEVCPFLILILPSKPLIDMLKTCLFHYSNLQSLMQLKHCTPIQKNSLQKLPKLQEINQQLFLHLLYHPANPNPNTIWHLRSRTWLTPLAKVASMLFWAAFSPPRNLGEGVISINDLPGSVFWVRHFAKTHCNRN